MLASLPRIWKQLQLQLQPQRDMDYWVQLGFEIPKVILLSPDILSFIITDKSKYSLSDVFAE